MVYGMRRRVSGRVTETVCAHSKAARSAPITGHTLGRGRDGGSKSKGLRGCLFQRVTFDFNVKAAAFLGRDWGRPSLRRSPHQLRCSVISEHRCLCNCIMSLQLHASPSFLAAAPFFFACRIGALSRATSCSSWTFCSLLTMSSLYHEGAGVSRF